MPELRLENGLFVDLSDVNGAIVGKYFAVHPETYHSHLYLEHPDSGTISLNTFHWCVTHLGTGRRIAWVDSSTSINNKVSALSIAIELGKLDFNWLFTERERESKAIKLPQKAMLIIKKYGGEYTLKEETNTEKLTA